MDDETLHLAYAEVSIMLIESLVHILLERRTMTLDEIQQAMDTALETKKDFIRSNMHPQISLVAAGVLRRLNNSVSASAAARKQDGHDDAAARPAP